MRVALVVPRNAPGTHNFHQVPIGTLYTADRLRRRGVAVSVHDLRFDDPDDASYAEIGGADLAVVCSTDYDLAQCYPTLVPAAECVGRIKAAGPAVVACVGSHGTAEASLTRTFTGADVVVAGSSSSRCRSWWRRCAPAPRSSSGGRPKESGWRPRPS